MFAFNAQGDTFTLTKLFALSTLINLLCDPLLIFGWGSVPAMGISGAAISTLFSQAVFIVIALWVLSRESRTIQFHWSNINIKLESVKRVLSIGVPAAMTQLVNPLGMAAVTYITSMAFLEPGAVAFSLGFRIEFFAYLPAIGFGFGAMAMMGQSIGAENIVRARTVLSIALRYAVCIATIFGLLAAIFAHHIIAFFTKDPAVTVYALSYFRIVALSYGFLAAMMVEASAFQAVGKSWPGFWIALVRLTIITIPVSYIGAIVMGYDITIVWTAIVIGNIVASLVGYVWITKTLSSFDFTKVEEATHANL